LVVEWWLVKEKWKGFWFLLKWNCSCSYLYLFLTLTSQYVLWFPWYPESDLRAAMGVSPNSKGLGASLILLTMQAKPDQADALYSAQLDKALGHHWCVLSLYTWNLHGLYVFVYEDIHTVTNLDIKSVTG
jgi:hypothetical protein